MSNCEFCACRAEGTWGPGNVLLQLLVEHPSRNGDRFIGADGPPASFPLATCADLGQGDNGHSARDDGLCDIYSARANSVNMSRCFPTSRAIFTDRSHDQDNNCGHDRCGDHCHRLPASWGQGETKQRGSTGGSYSTSVAAAVFRQRPAINSLLLPIDSYLLDHGHCQRRHHPSGLGIKSVPQNLNPVADIGLDSNRYRHWYSDHDNRNRCVYLVNYCNFYRHLRNHSSSG